jgi:septal ring-binding cell division protein DamX
MDLQEALHRGAALRAAAPQGSWTLRLVVSGRADGLKQVARAAGPKAPDVLVLPYVRPDGFRWWQACYGAYPTRAAALKAWSQAPAPLKKAFHDALPLKLQRLPGDPPKVDPSRG